MNSRAVVLEQPGRIRVNDVVLAEPGESDVVVQVDHSGISTGTEKLLYTGRMPTFPGMGYPLVPGYESVGRVLHAGPKSGFVGGESVYVPGARCFGEIRGLFGGSASRLVVAGEKAMPISDSLGEQGTLLALAATAATAGTSGTEFQGLHTTLTGWTEGFLGKALAIAAFLFGAGMGVAKQTVVPAILGVVFALVFSVGPDIINTMMTAVI